MKKILKILGMLLLIGMLVIILDVGCLFRYVTGFPCPGCGVTRACISFVQGHIVDAFYWHPLFWLTVPLLVICVFTNGKLARSDKTNHRIWMILGCMYITVYVVRMILLFPDTPPMNYNYEAIGYRIIRPILEKFNLAF